MEIVIVETNLENPPPPEELEKGARRLDECLERVGAKWMRTYETPDHKRDICVFLAEDAESVRASYRSTDTPFDRVWTATMWEAEDVERLGTLTKSAKKTA